MPLIPPSAELDTMCRKAREVSALCKMIGRGEAPTSPDRLREANVLLDGVLDALFGENLHVTDHDPDTDPFIWE